MEQKDTHDRTLTEALGRKVWQSDGNLQVIVDVRSSRDVVNRISRLQHPRLCRGSITDGRIRYEYSGAKSLKNVLASETVDVQRSLHIAHGIAEALEALRQNDFSHGLLMAETVMVALEGVQVWGYAVRELELPERPITFDEADLGPVYPAAADDLLAYGSQLREILSSVTGGATKSAEGEALTLLQALAEGCLNATVPVAIAELSKVTALARKILEDDSAAGIAVDDWRLLHRLFGDDVTSISLVNQELRAVATACKEVEDEGLWLNITQLRRVLGGSNVDDARLRDAALQHRAMTKNVGPDSGHSNKSPLTIYIPEELFRVAVQETQPVRSTVVSSRRRIVRNSGITAWQLTHDEESQKRLFQLLDADGIPVPGRGPKKAKKFMDLMKKGPERAKVLDVLRQDLNR